jgi:antirestriction protein ArdC
MSCSHAAEDRLGMAKPSKFGDEEYSRGEMRVEICAAMICRHYDLPTNTESQAGYATSWLKNLREDKNAFPRAVREAGQIFEYLMAFDPAYVPRHQHEEAPKPMDHVTLASSLPRPVEVLADRMLD